MAARVISLELLDELVMLLGTPEAAARQAKQALVLDLLREARIGQGMAAELLGLTRADILDQMTQHHILSGPATAEEASCEIEEMHRFFAARTPDDSDQRQ